MPYIVGISSGIFSIAKQTQEREGAIQYAGIARKVSGFPIMQGVTFAQIDLESIAEFMEPNLVESMKRVREQLGLSYGFHSESASFGGEFPYLDESIEDDYRRAHERVFRILQGAANIEAEYVLLHSSESTSFLLLGKDLQPTRLVDIWGRPMRDWLKSDEEYVKELMDWLVENYQKYIEQLGLPHLSATVSSIFSRKYEKLRFDKLKTQTDIASEEEEKITKEAIREGLVEYVSSNDQEYGTERFAYFVVAKWMELRGDPLWKKIIDITIKYFAKLDNKEPREWLINRGINPDELVVENSRFYNDFRLWVPAVSARYIWGHFFPEKAPGGGSRYENMDFKKIIKEKKMPFILETPMSGTAIEEWTRMPNPLQMYYLVKEVNQEFPYMGLAIDLEHMIAGNINPDIVVELLPEDAGKLVRVIHTGYPSPIMPAHIHIPIGSEQMWYLYYIYYKLRKKGFGKDGNMKYWLVFERGGPEEVRQSIEAIKIIVAFLEKETDPFDIKKHPEKYKQFYGVDFGQLASIERQQAIIREYSDEPLKGLLQVPEEDHGILGRAAVEKGKAEEWKKEKYR